MARPARATALSLVAETAWPVQAGASVFHRFADPIMIGDTPWPVQAAWHCRQSHRVHVSDGERGVRVLDDECQICLGGV